jgi:hypothetical protein
MGHVGMKISAEELGYSQSDNVECASFPLTNSEPFLCKVFFYAMALLPMVKYKHT